MLKKNDIKLIRSLRQKKYRQKYNKFVVEGEKMALESINFVKNSIDSVFCTDDFAQNMDSILRNVKDKIQIVSQKELAQISDLKTANSVLVVLNKLDDKNNENIKNFKTIVYLDNIKDPGNMGTIIRTCEWFAVDLLVVSPESVDVYNPKVIQSTMGSIFRMPIVEFDFMKLRNKLKDFNFSYYGATLDGISLSEMEYDFPNVIVIGSESHGISNEIESILDEKLTIPRYNRYTESLNAAVATGIILSSVQKEVTNQHYLQFPEK